ncbi:5'-methylthioadenosine/S-adenosylhomocysteine nucleosidase [Maioricimonas rarisocia]|uniref:5'-methylthioadenosine/S-adenosylhomocysteine nucleosidase n=1 Tax=Maioricimonas rarisocia TaxID=2528026 RepID=A0A517Z8H7_9PLAN|nr:5'-methylthioadenosine nucleosidase [Maioricimonas rarisocia]QDU38773.1 5'-methylthioadenosine/S-adenosylhomocysteine nucleosidase [Maioricimonas rarisocia]
MSETSEPTSDKAHADIGIVCALKMELGPFLARCDRVRKYVGGKFVFRGGFLGDARVAIVESGAGFAKARRATQALVDAHTPDWVISAGFSGALRDEMRIGDIVVANSIVDTHGHELSVDMNMEADPEHGLHVGRLVTADEIVRTIDEKRALADRTEALACDMESLAVAQVCQETRTRFMAIRSISDDLSRDLPAEVLTVLGGSGSIRAGAIAASLIKRPSSVSDMWKLREQAQTAADKLSRFLDPIVEQLYEHR